MPARSAKEAMKLFSRQIDQRSYNLAALGFFTVMVGVMVVSAFIAHYHPDTHPLVGNSDFHFRFYGVLLGLVMAVALFLSYLRGNTLALKLSTLIAVVTVTAGLKAEASKRASSSSTASGGIFAKIGCGFGTEVPATIGSEAHGCTVSPSL